MKGVRPAITVLVLAAALAGCASTRNTLFVEADDAARDGDFLGAAQLIERNQDRMYTNRDGVLYYLDTGMLLHFAGEHQESTLRLEEAERLIEEYFTRSISQAAATFLINDTMRNYAGEDFEDIYLNVFKALNFLEEGQTESAMVEARRINIKLNLLEDRHRSLAAGYSGASEAAVGPAMEPAENRFFNSALARYLSLVLHRAEGNMDGVRIDWQFVQDAFQQQANLYDFPNPLDESTARRPTDSRVSVLAFTGRSPVKLAQTLWILTGQNTVTIIYAEEDERLGRIPQGLASFHFPGVEPGLRFKFELPRLHPRGSEITRIRVLADGRALGEPKMLENMEEIALDTYRVREPIIFVKTVTRTLVKSLAGYRAGQAMRQLGRETGSPIGLVAGILGSVATEIALDASEQADLRVSRYFPAYAYVGEWDLPPGEYEIDVEYYRGDRVVHVDRLGNVRVSPDSPNVLSSYVAR